MKGYNAESIKVVYNYETTDQSEAMVAEISIKGSTDIIRADIEDTHNIKAAWVHTVKLAVDKGIDKAMRVDLSRILKDTDIIGFSDK